VVQLLKTSKAIHDSEARVLRGTRLGLDLELCEPKCLVDLFPIDQERRDKIDFFVLFHMTRPFFFKLLNQQV